MDPPPKNRTEKYKEMVDKVARQNIIAFFGQFNHILGVLSNFWSHPNGIKIVFEVPTKYQRDGFPKQLRGLFGETIIMALKAMIFNDIMSFNKIMSSIIPKDIKEFGRKVTGFIEEVWTEAITTEDLINNIIFQMLLAKFADPLAQQLLLNTKNFFLIEAARNDFIWGVGFDVKNPNILNKNLWGWNLLGMNLMDVREYYRNALSSTPVPKNLTKKQQTQALLDKEADAIESKKFLKEKKAAEQAAKQVV
jgi:ribA/ribD-fused uncharacterized protein